jgi:hypothetical protein
MSASRRAIPARPGAARETHPCPAFSSPSPSTPPAFFDFLASLWSETGPQLDPNGGPAPKGDEGASLDPDGAAQPQADEGPELDPDG